MSDMDAQRSKPSSLEPSTKAWVFLVGTSDHPCAGDLAWRSQLARKPWKDQRPNSQNNLHASRLRQWGQAIILFASDVTTGYRWMGP